MSLRRAFFPALVLAVLLPSSLPAQQAASLKVFISVDMEGLAGVVTGSDVTPGSLDYAHFRAIMAAETNAAIDGAFHAGATEVLVRDSHGSKQNLLPGDVDPRARLLRGASTG
ncbi:MAG: M55 family metallopeptidase, partial [Longimicrobiales bacterium]